MRPIAGGVEVLAPAKLNLFLEVLGRRPDGYHEIESLMVRVALHDRLTLADEPSGRIELRCDDPGVPAGRANLVVRAAEALRAEARVDRGARITLEKRIPAQAGLGGGSSDAAATLEALDQLWDLRTPPARLAELAGAIGSDVAFFLGGPAAVCRGRGERVEPIGPSPTYHFVLIKPPVGLRTAEVYGRLTPPERPRPIGPVLEAFGRGDAEALGQELFNRLGPTAEALAPDLARVRSALEGCGPDLTGSLISGSGSAHFGLGRDRDAAGRAARNLETLGLGSVRVVTCGP